MKKESFIVAIIVIVIIIAHVLTQNTIKNFFNSVSADLDSLEEKIFDNNFESGELEKDIENIEENWDKNYDKFACYIEHDELEKVETQLISIKANIRVGDYDKGIDEAERCKFILKHIKEKDSMRIVNIF